MSTVRYRDDDSGPSTSVITALLGAAAGFAVGMYLAQRFGGFAGMASRLRKRATEENDGSALYEATGDGYHSDEYAIDDPFEDDAPDDAGEDEFDDDDVAAADLDGEGDETLDAEGEPDNGRQPAPKLEERVLEAFTNDPVLSERAIDIGATDDGEVELEGWVDDDSEAELAVTIARGVPGVKAVSNHLMVDD